MLDVSRRTGIGALLAALICLCDSTAHAQWSGHATASYGRSLGALSLSQGNLALSRNALRDRAARRGSAAQATQAPGRHDVALTYTPDPQLTEKIRVSMIDLASAENPASRPEWEKATAGDGILRDFDTLMTTKGYSRLNFADDVAMLLAVCWEVVNDRDATDAQFRGARTQMHSAAQINPTLRGLPNSERQALAESIAYQVMIMFATKVSADRAGNQAKLAELRESATKAASQYGIDVAHMQLTEKGFRKP
jgi:hypothetical protein